MKRRKILIGLLGAGASVGPLSAQAQQPTVSVSSDACETVRVAYNSEGPPAVSVTLTGPEELTTTLERGESETLSVAAGTYEVEAQPARGGDGSTRAVAIGGSPIAVEPCQLLATVDCDSQTLTFENPTDDPIHIRYRVYRLRRPSYETDLVLSRRGWRVIEPDEIEEFGEFSVREDRESYFWAHTESRDRDETLPINGEPSPLHLPMVPCEELDI